MFGEPPSGPNTNPLPSSTQDPRAMLAYAEAMAAQAKYIQLLAAMPQPHVSMPAAAAVAHVQPSHSKHQTGASNPKPSAAATVGPSLFTVVVCLIVGAVAGAMCNQELAQQQQPQPSQQVSRQ